MPEHSEFTDGFLVAAALVARRGADTIAAELMQAVGITSVVDLEPCGLNEYDRTPLLRVLRLGQ